MAFTLKPRTLWAAASNSMLSPISLQDVRNHLAQMTNLHAPKDHIVSMANLDIRYENGKMMAYVPGVAEPHYVLNHAGHQLSRLVLPAGFYSGLKVLAGRDAEGEKLATDVWRKFASTLTEPQRVRVVRAKVKDKVILLLRACVSTSYSVYPHLRFVDDVLEYSGEWAQLPVLDWAITDTGLRIRFSGLDMVTSAFAAVDKSLLDNALVPMIQLRNSEVGMAKIGLYGGCYRLSTGTAVGHWEKKEGYSWRHVGKTERIRAEIKQAFERTTVIAQDVAAAYDEATHIVVEDLHGWTAEVIKTLMTEGEAAEVIKHLTDSRVYPGGVLATAVDAIALVSKRRAPMRGPIPENHPEPDIYKQDLLEYAAAKVLHQGRQIANNNNGRIPA